MNLTPVLRQRLVAVPAALPGVALALASGEEIAGASGDPDWAVLAVRAGLAGLFLLVPAWCLLRPTLSRAAGALAIFSLAVFVYFGRGLAVVVPGAFAPFGDRGDLVRHAVAAVVAVALYVALRRWVAGPRAGAAGP